MPLQQTSILYKDTSYPHYYLYNYLPVAVGKDALSHSLLKFKRGLRPDLNTWIDCALAALDNNIIPSGSIILRALHHDEIFVREDTPTSLDKLGTALAQRFHSHYLPLLLRKSLHTPSIKGLSKEQRAAQLQDIYYMATSSSPLSWSPIDPPSTPSGAPALHPSFLIIDDVLTTGTTMKMIINALQPAYPHARLVIFTLARADYDNIGKNIF